MVCLGNICRSPLAEGILRKKARERGLPIEVDSAGTGSWHVGQNPDPRAITVAQKYNIDISTLCGRQFSSSDFDQFDKILVMDENNYKNVIALARDENDKSKVDFLLNSVTPKRNDSVPDPYFGGDQGFEKVYRMLDQACDKLLENMGH